MTSAPCHPTAFIARSSFPPIYINLSRQFAFGDFLSAYLRFALFPSFVKETQISSNDVFELYVREGRPLKREWKYRYRITSVFP